MGQGVRIYLCTTLDAHQSENSPWCQQYFAIFFAHEGLCNFSLSLYIGQAGSNFNALMLKSKAPGAFQSMPIFGYITIWKY
jgi:hypothetical protein